MIFPESICHIHLIIRYFILLFIKFVEHFVFFLVKMIFEFIQKISFIICEKNRILHTFVIEPYRNQKRIPQKVKNAVVTDCHEKSGKILILIGIEQSRRKNRSRNVCPGTFAFFCGWYHLKEGVF